MSEALFINYRKLISSITGNDESKIIVDPPKQKMFGDFSTTLPMLLAKELRRPPMDIAEELASLLMKHPNFMDVEIKNPGFINWKIPADILISYFPNIMQPNFGFYDLGKNKSINIEYVSANPTGPLHAGHARGAVSGDVLANLLSFVGFNVTKEYYINDAGNQINILAKSLYHRYQELFNSEVGELASWAYPGEYLIDIAKEIKAEYGDKFVNLNEESWLPLFKEKAVNNIMDDIKKDLHSLGIHHDVFTSELSIIENGDVEEAMDFLGDAGFLYNGKLEKPKGGDVENWEENDLLLFRSKNFGDDVDRPVKKSDGSWTYFASDIAYHRNKIKRKYDELIDFFGADHGGYVKRMEAVVNALSNNKVKFGVKLCQLVRFIDNGVEVKMSKRAGTFITVRDIINHVGKDVIRFIMLTRKDDAPLDFDFKKVIEQNKDNPIFYIQYAHARVCSVIKQFEKVFVDKKLPDIDQCDLTLLIEDNYLAFIKMLCDWPRQIIMAAKSREPHRIAFYLSDLAANFHSLWNYGHDHAQLRFVLQDDFSKTASRMYLLKAFQNVITIGFKIIGITPMEELR